MRRALPIPATLPRVAVLLVSAPLVASVLLAGLAIAAPAPGIAQERVPQHVLADAQVQLDALRPHVEHACGRQFEAPPKVLLVSPERAAEWFRKDLEPQIARTYRDASVAQRRALLRMAAASSVASCLARYSWSAKAILVVRESFDRQRASAGFGDDEAADLLRAVLAHEAVHALDDEKFELGSLFTTPGTAEGLRAVSMVVEGRAVHFGRAAAKRAGVAERAFALLPGGARPADASAWTLRLTYEGGAAFVAALENDRDAQSVHSEGALVSPPQTTHEVFHPERWRSRRLESGRGPGPDPRPAARLREAGFAEQPDTISELQLRARYASLLDAEKSDALFARFLGGAQVLADSTNCAVLAFADTEAADAYVAIAGKEAPTERDGTLVLRAYGPAAEAHLERLRSP